ncbi:hypothetical protein Tco_0505524 [Tanacetum coccineum]
MDGGERVDVPWTMAKFIFDKAKGYKKKSLIVGAHLIGRIARSYGLMALAYMRIVTLGQETSLINVVKIVDLGICRYNNGLGLGELVDDQDDHASTIGFYGEFRTDEMEARKIPELNTTTVYLSAERRSPH